MGCLLSSGVFPYRCSTFLMLSHQKGSGTENVLAPVVLYHLRPHNVSDAIHRTCSKGLVKEIRDDKIGSNCQRISHCYVTPLCRPILVGWRMKQLACPRCLPCFGLMHSILLWHVAIRARSHSLSSRPKAGSVQWTITSLAGWVSP